MGRCVKVYLLGFFPFDMGDSSFLSCENKKPYLKLKMPSGALCEENSLTGLLLKIHTERIILCGCKNQITYQVNRLKREREKTHTLCF